ncbi:Glucosamine 6-phosphate N-acetyltransferase [Rhodotorula toruloides]|nr:Glucosamine 6-phosphate N-acetyltransferase [Rhodotorula toruloides]
MVRAGSTLCLALEEHVRERRGKAADVTRGKETFDLIAHSQKIAEVFYHRLGWKTVGEDFLEEGQPHCKVVKTIQLNPEPAIAVLNGSKPPTRSYAVRWCETQADIDRCIQIRIAVFVDEQGFSMEDELDEKDPVSDHFLMTTVDAEGKEEDVGTIRWWPKPGLAAGKIGRVCVLPKYRGGGTGKLLMTSIEEHVRNRRGKAGEASKGKESVTAVVHSQMHAEGFYSKAGYVREGDKFMEDGAFHCKLVKEIQLVPETA